MNEKDALRYRALEKRKNFWAAQGESRRLELARAAWTRLRAWLRRRNYPSPTRVLSYENIGSEVPTLHINRQFRAGGARVVCPPPGLTPRVLEAGPVRSLEASRPELIIVPGLAFSPQGHRLGRGLGWYDRFLTALRAAALAHDPKPPVLGLCYDFQLFPAVPYEHHDVAMDGLIILETANFVAKDTEEPSKRN